MSTLKQINRAIAKAGIPVELERGDGYHYFIYDNEERGVYETVSYMVCYTNSVPLQRWVVWAQEAYDDIINSLNISLE